MKLRTTKLKNYITLGVLWISLFSNCKKSELKNPESTLSDHENAIAAAAKFFDKEGRKVTLITGAKGTSGLADEDGNLISSASPQTMGYSNGTTTLGVTSCTDANGDPIYSFDAVEFTGYSSFVCGINNGYKIQVTFKITTELPLVATSTKGMVRLKNASNAIVYSNTNITPVSVVATSQVDPSFPNSTVYLVQYESGYISQSVYQSAQTVENSCLLKTSCSDPANVSTQYLAQYRLFIGNISTTPCNRIDQIYFNPPIGGPGYISGTNGAGQCSYISGYTLPNGHDIEFQAVSGGAVSKTIFLANYDVKTVYSGSGIDNSLAIYLLTGTYKVRYRNSMVSGTPCVGPWSEFGPNITF